LLLKLERLLEELNKAIGNVSYSRHQWGGAADIFIDGLFGKSFYEPYHGGLGQYLGNQAHGPLVLWLLGVLMQLGVVARGGALVSDQWVARSAFWALLLGTVAAGVAAIFGDMALEIAMDKGFPLEALEAHEEIASTALWLFVAISACLVFVRWRGIHLKPALNWGLVVLGLVGLVVMFYAAYLGGQLVYDLGRGNSDLKTGLSSK